MSSFYSSKVGSFWFRVSVRENDDYTGYLSAYFNVPGLFGSVVYQSKNFIGVDCADVLVAAAHQWKGKRIKKNYNVAMLVNKLPKVKKVAIDNGRPARKLKWGVDFKRGDLMAVRYAGARK